jgi:NAD-dependent deacetylase
VGKSPNAGHRAVTELAGIGKVAAVITQNVDNLHRASGLPPEKIIELHGNAGYAACLDCGLRHELADLKAAFLETDALPACRECGGIVKTATISFGQPLPREALVRAEAETLACDLFLVLGSSLLVYPAMTLPILAKRNGARLVIVNREPTDQDELADLVLHDEIGPAMSEVASLL